MSDPLRPEAGVVKAPANVNVLRSRIDRYAKESGLGITRVQQRVYTELIIGLLDNARHKGVIPLFVVKGGMALELRFGIRARASGDLDINLSGDDVLALIDDALAVGFGGFTFERPKDSIYLENVKTHRVEIKISYKGRAFGTIDLDINAAKAETSAEMMTTSVITHLGLPGPLLVPIIDAHVHLAHKLHAATEPSRVDYKNVRYRDLIDALVIARAGSLDFAFLRTVAIEEFAHREHHKVWPPVWTLPNEWYAPLKTLAKIHKFEPTDPKGIEREIIALIARIEGVPVKTNYEYHFLVLEAHAAVPDPMSGAISNRGAFEAFERMTKIEGWRLAHMMRYPSRDITHAMLAVLERLIESDETA